jgi:hypothetical protein
MKKLLKSLLFWRKDTSKEEREKEAEQKFEKYMTELVNAIKDTSVSQVKLQNTVTESLTLYSESVSEIMQSFQDQLDKMEEQFELFFHKENRQSRILQKDINHIGSRIEFVFEKIEVLIKSNRDIMKEISSLKPIPVDPFNQAEPIVRNYDMPLPLYDDAPLQLHNLVKKSNPPLRIKDCLDCGDEFIYTHKNQLYCPKKHGITNYCKTEAKYKLSKERKS